MAPWDPQARQLLPPHFPLLRARRSKEAAATDCVLSVDLYCVCDGEGPECPSKLPFLCACLQSLFLYSPPCFLPPLQHVSPSAAVAELMWFRLLCFPLFCPHSRAFSCAFRPSMSLHTLSHHMCCFFQSLSIRLSPCGKWSWGQPRPTSHLSSLVGFSGRGLWCAHHPILLVCVCQKVLQKAPQSYHLYGEREE